MPAPRVIALALFPLALAAGLLAAARQEPTATVETRAVAGQVHYLVGDGGNAVVMVGEDGVLLVDDKYERHAQAIDAAVRALGHDGPTWLVNTHWHGDHTGSNAHFGAEATILAHANVRRRLAGDAGIGGRVADPAAPARALPVVTYEDGVVLHVNGEDVRVVAVGPAHTDGDSVVWFPGSNVVHMGDLFFELGYPFVDLDSGGDVQGVIDGCRQVLSMVPADARVVPGHGNATDVEGLKAYVAMIEECLRRVRAGVAEGKDADELLAEGVVQDFDARWGGFAFVTPERWVKTLVRYVKG